MGIGLSVFLIAVGAILSFAVHATLSGVSIQAVGVILMVAGALGLLVTMTVFAPRRRATFVEQSATTTDPYLPGRTIARERVVERHDVS